MSTDPEVIRAYSGIDIDSDLINAAKKECDGLDLSTTDSCKDFPPQENCNRIIDSLRKKVCLLLRQQRGLMQKLKKLQISRKGTGRTVFVLLPGPPTTYLEPTCIAVPIKKEGLPASMISKTGQSVTVNWDEGKVWERQAVKPAAVNQKGGTLLLWHLE